MSRNTAALIIAILFHLLVILLFWLMGMLFVKQSKPSVAKEQRIKVALKELKTSKQNAALKNRVPPSAKIPPMPKGSQLDKPDTPVPNVKPLPTPKELIPADTSKPVPKPMVKPKTPPAEKPMPKTEAVPPEKPYIPFMRPEEKVPPKPAETSETNATDVPKDQQKLFAKLSKKQKSLEQPSEAAQAYKREGRIPRDIREAYGDAFGKLSEGEQKYLLDNEEIMRRLTQAQLDDTGRTMIPNSLRVNDANVVEFYLHPNGDMTDFRFVTHSGFFLLDEVTKETIEAVYWKYPRPKQKTLIRYKFGYYLRGY